jgi:hypothetical protein
MVQDSKSERGDRGVDGGVCGSGNKNTEPTKTIATLGAMATVDLGSRWRENWREPGV